MSQPQRGREILTGARLFDGTCFIDDHALVIEDGVIAAILPETKAPTQDRRDVPGIIAPAFIDLQVNGGDGLMVDGTTDPDALRRICAAHRNLGSAGILPTLITDTPEATARIIAAGLAAARADVPGFLGLHLEGPHLDPRRKGAHDPALIRPMNQDDLARLCDAAQRLPSLMVTLAPEASTPQQIATLAGAGAVVSLGHSDCSYEQAQAAFAAGARCVTHLFNAMSQLGHRMPGLAGAVISGKAAAGLIADGIHVHPATMRIALTAREQGIFLVSDCMAFAGTEQTGMLLHGRQVLRRDGRLTLADGTLAGADLTLPQAIAVLIDQVGITPERALRMTTTEPAQVIGLEHSHGTLAPGRKAELVRLDSAYRLVEHWL